MLDITADKKIEYEEVAIENFRTYLRIPSVHPDVDYSDCVKFVQVQAKSLGLPSKVVEVHPEKPVVIVTWEGTEPSLQSIVCSSHMDVVPVFEDQWTHKPFAADMDEEARIFARGAQDMKCVGIQYLEAIRRMKENGVRLKRTVHCTFIPDEEIGGLLGMVKFVKTQEFKDLNLGFAMDEGMASEDNNFILYYGEKAMWNIMFHCPGEPGHGSQLIENSASQKLRKLMDIIDDFRNEQIAALKEDPSMTLGDVVVVNATILKGGVQFNVLPAEICVGIDCRLPVTTNITKWTATLDEWCKDAGDDVWYEVPYCDQIVEPTKLDDTNPFWKPFRDAVGGDRLSLQIFPAGTDSQNIRALGLPTFNFSPICNTLRLLHSNDEYLGKDMFLEGIEVYMRIISAVANV